METINDLALSLNADEHTNLTFQRHWQGLLNDTGGTHNRAGDNDKQPSADDNVWRGEDLKAHLDGEPSITQPVGVTPLLCPSKLKMKHAEK